MPRRQRKKGCQLSLPIKGRGGWRPGAGRPRKPGAGVAHVRRPVHAERYPLHVTTRVLSHVWNLRSRRSAQVLRRSFVRGKDRFGFRLIQFSVQGNHLHLIVEATDKRALTRGMKGLGVRIARGMNRLMHRRGRVISDRYHARELRTPAEVRAALVYVLNNARHHPCPTAARFDAYSSAAYFDGWREACELARSPVLPVVPARCWLMTVGWRRRGLIDPLEGPSSAAAQVTPQHH